MIRDPQLRHDCDGHEEKDLPIAEDNRLEHRSVVRS